MSANRTMLLQLAFCGAAAAVFLVSPAVAQQAQEGQEFPFFPKGFGGNPEEFFERMLGTPAPEERETLEDVKIPFKEERDFGQPQVDAFLAQLKEQGLRVIRKGKDVDYLRQLVETIRPFMKNARRYEKITIYVVDSPRVDARSFPGGTVFFFRGLLAMAETEAALIGIVGHELSHLDRGHILMPLKRGKLMQRTFDEAVGGFDPRKFLTSG